MATKNSKNSTMNNNETRVICPKCGAEIAIPETTSLAFGIAIGKDSGLGTIVLPAADDTFNPKDMKKKKLNTPEEKMAALKAAGIDVTNFFVIPGSPKIFKPSDGTVVEVDEQDPVIKKILEAGDVPVYRLYRRWVMAQMFRMLNSEKEFTESLNAKGYFYQWKMTAEEFRVQAILQKKDPEYLPLRHIWFNADTLYNMIDQAIHKLEKENKPWGRKNPEYVTVAGAGIYLSRYNEGLEKLKKLRAKARNNMSLISLSNIALDVLAVFSQYFHRTDRVWKTCSAFQDAYKGSGSYYTMENLIRFHGCRFYNPLTGKKLGEDASMKQAQALAEKNAAEGTGYKMLGILKEFLRVNKIDIAKKIASWRK